MNPLFSSAPIPFHVSQRLDLACTLSRSTFVSEKQLRLGRAVASRLTNRRIDAPTRQNVETHVAAARRARFAPYIMRTARRRRTGKRERQQNDSRVCFRVRGQPPARLLLAVFFHPIRFPHATKPPPRNAHAHTRTQRHRHTHTHACGTTSTGILGPRSHVAVRVRASLALAWHKQRFDVVFCVWRALRWPGPGSATI